MRSTQKSRIGGIILAAALGWSLPGVAGETANSQVYTASRYAIVGAEIDVSLQQGGISNYRRRVILKLDTATGATSVLQLAQLGIGNPTVTSAVWAPVADFGTFLINNNLSIRKL